MPDQLYERGALYKAVTEMNLKKLETEQIDGLKLHVFPEQLKPLRELQRALRSRFGSKPDLKFVLNGVLATLSFDKEVIGDWIANFYSATRQENSKSEQPRSWIDEIKDQQTDRDQD